jgi:raffinose/stachyose/melibiose transport system permease protein
MKKQQKITWLGWIILALSFFWLVPLVMIFLNSFKPYNDMMQNFLSWPTSWRLDRYVDTWTTFGFPVLIGNTLLYTAVSVLGIVLIAPMAAYKLARTRSRYSSVVFVLIILPMMVPFQAYMISLTKFAAILSLTGTKTGYICVSIGLLVPLAVYMIHGFIKNVPLDLEESALIDGAGPFICVISATCCRCSSILTTVVVLDALATWNDVITNQLIVAARRAR